MCRLLLAHAADDRSCSAAVRKGLGTMEPPLLRMKDDIRVSAVKRALALQRIHTCTGSRGSGGLGIAHVVTNTDRAYATYARCTHYHARCTHYHALAQMSHWQAWERMQVAIGRRPWRTALA